MEPSNEPTECIMFSMTWSNDLLMAYYRDLFFPILEAGKSEVKSLADWGVVRAQEKAAFNATNLRQESFNRITSPKAPIPNTITIKGHRYIHFEGHASRL